jgi:hypothetical protein
MFCGQSTRRAVLLAIVAAATLRCAGAVRPIPATPATPLSSWWVPPHDLPNRDLFHGPWGVEHAPDPRAEYTFVRPKTGGFNPGVIVRDPQGREWHVKQASRNAGDEGPSEVVLSRVLSALGYHQPPVYYLPSFRMRDGSSVHMERGGRFRLDLTSLQDQGEWSWQQNPFIGQQPYQGLLVILLLFNSSDLKNSNNTIYEYSSAPGRSAPVRWYVVRDLGDALGRTGRISPQRNNIGAFAQTRFITGERRGFVEFDYHGVNKELVTNRITREDVRWAAALASGLTERQWRDAFRAGGYAPDVAARFIEILRARIADAQRVGAIASR